MAPAPLSFKTREGGGGAGGGVAYKDRARPPPGLRTPRCGSTNTYKTQKKNIKKHRPRARGGKNGEKPVGFFFHLALGTTPDSLMSAHTCRLRNCMAAPAASFFKNTEAPSKSTSRPLPYDKNSRNVMPLCISSIS